MIHFTDEFLRQEKACHDLIRLSAGGRDGTFTAPNVVVVLQLRSLSFYQDFLRVFFSSSLGNAEEKKNHERW